GGAAFAQAAPGEVEEHIVERGARDFDGVDGDAELADVVQQRCDDVRGVGDAHVQAGPGDVDVGSVQAARGRYGGAGIVFVGEAERDVVTCVLGLQARGRVVSDQATVVDHHDPFGHRIGFVQVMGGDHDGGAVFCAQLDDVLLQV